MTVPANLSQAYIDEHYITRPALAEMAGVPETKIVELSEKKCIPPRAYEVTNKAIFTSSFGSYELEGDVLHYYHPKHVDWIATAEEFAESYSLEEVAVRVRDKFTADILEALGNNPMPWPDGIALVWDYLMDGTWSLCLKEFDVPGLVQKELARRSIADITKKADPAHISKVDRAALRKAAAQFYEVALPFSPHEVGESSRCLEVNATVKKYGIETENSEQQECTQSAT